jgi:signal peptidase II
MSSIITHNLKKSNSRFIAAGIFLAAFWIILDQVTKRLVMDMIGNAGQMIEVLPFFNLVYVWNPGISFGLLQSGTDLGVYILIAIAAMITGLFAFLLFRAETLFVALACGTIIGGAIGNIIDRILYGAVYDFLDFHAFGYHWPAFNVADSCVLIGIAMIALDSLFLNPQTKDKAE